MNYLKKIFLRVSFFIFLPFLLQSQAASITVEDEYQKLENNFQNENLTEFQLKLFQTKSIQQLKDFLNLVDLISSEKYDSTFNKKLKDQALKSFSNKTDSLFFLKKGKIEGFTIERFLRDLETQKTTFPSVKFSDSKFSTPIFLDKKYAWKISFEFSKKDVNDKYFVADFILKKENKKFGKEEKEVWTVFIKRIKEIKKS